MMQRPYFWQADNQSDYIVFWDANANFTNFRLTLRLPSAVAQTGNGEVGQVTSAGIEGAGQALAVIPVTGAGEAGEVTTSGIEGSGNNLAVKEIGSGELGRVTTSGADGTGQSIIPPPGTGSGEASEVTATGIEGTGTSVVITETGSGEFGEVTASGLESTGSLVTLLVLSDSDDTGLDIVAKALLVASAPGTSGNSFYADSDRSGTDTPLDGELGVGPDDTIISRFRRANATTLLLNDNDNPIALDIGAYFDTGAAGNNLTIYLQTLAGGEVTFDVASQITGGRGPAVVRFTLPTDAQTLLDNLATGDRWIFKAARPVVNVQMGVGEAGQVVASAIEGTGSRIATTPSTGSGELANVTTAGIEGTGRKIFTIPATGSGELATVSVSGIEGTGRDEVDLTDFTKIAEVRGISYSRTGIDGASTHAVILRARDKSGNIGTQVRAGEVITTDLLDVFGSEFIFLRNNTGVVPSTPISTDAQRRMDNYIPLGWTDSPQGVDENNRYEYVSARTGSPGRWSDFGVAGLYDIFIIPGDTEAQFIFRRTTTASAPNTPLTNANQRADDNYVPPDWSSSAQGTTETLLYEWASYRLGKSGGWSTFYAPTLREAFPTARGPIPFLRAITGNVWTNAEADLATTGDNVTGDRVTLYNTTADWTATRVWDGSNWITVGKWIDGNLIVEGTVLSIFDIIAGAAVQSANYDAGIAGWRIAQDGGAEFDAAVIRGILEADHIDADVRNWQRLWVGTDILSHNSASTYTWLGNHTWDEYTAFGVQVSYGDMRAIEIISADGTPSTYRNTGFWQ